MIAKFRIDHGWQTEDGRDRISKARKGTFPCVDVVTGDPVGSHHKDHPNIVSGKWVHHSKGKISCYDENGNKVYLTAEERKRRGLHSVNKGRHVGSQNNNFKEMTQGRRERLFSLVPKCLSENHLIATRLQIAMKEEFTEFKKISIVWLTNNFGTVENFVAEYNKYSGESVVYERYYRSPEQKATAKSAMDKIHKRKYNNG